jgi:hypothetical protein
VVHYEEDLVFQGGVFSGIYPTGGATMLVTKGVQLILIDSVLAKAASSAAGVGFSNLIVPAFAAVQGSESGQAFRVRAYSAVSGAGVSGFDTEFPPGALAGLTGLPVHVAYEAT